MMSIMNAYQSCHTWINAYRKHLECIHHLYGMYVMQIKHADVVKLHIHNLFYKYSLCLLPTDLIDRRNKTLILKGFTFLKVPLLEFLSTPYITTLRRGLNQINLILKGLFIYIIITIIINVKIKYRLMVSCIIF